jgi:hypothetical protein
MTVKEMAGDASALPASRGTVTMPAPTIIEVAAREVAEELKRQGISPDERVTLTIEPELFPGRRESRRLVVAAGLTDEDIDRLIEQARERKSRRVRDESCC